MKNLGLAGVALVGWVFAHSQPGQASTLTSIIRGDDSFSAYLSTSDDIQGEILIGSAADYHIAYTYTTPGLIGWDDYFLHIMVWDGGGKRGLYGAFSLDGTDHFFANNTISLSTSTPQYWTANKTGWADAYNITPAIANGLLWPEDGVSGNVAYFSTKISAAQIPEPGPFALLGIGIAGLAFSGKRRVAVLASQHHVTSRGDGREDMRN